MKTFYLTTLVLVLGFGTIKAQEAEETQVITQTEEVVEPAVNWETSYKEALKKAEEENKPLLIYFTGSDWCGPCKNLAKNLFETEKFKEYANTKIVLYKADFPRNKNLVNEEARKINKKLSLKFGQRKFPTMIMVNAKEKELGIKEGMYMAEYYYPFFEKAILNN